jgi:hypothetical protein
MNISFSNQNQQSTPVDGQLQPQTPSQQNSDTGTPHVHLKKNIYPTARHLLLVACVLLTLCVLVFLVHQNGKSIYENGL